MKKQIEEMALTLSEGGCGNECDCIQGDKFNCHLLHSASVLYNAGYRKQKEVGWIVSGMFDDFLKCSSCGYQQPWQTAIEYKYCPNCGGKMKGGAE